MVFCLTFLPPKSRISDFLRASNALLDLGRIVRSTNVMTGSKRVYYKQKIRCDMPWGAGIAWEKSFPVHILYSHDNSDNVLQSTPLVYCCLIVFLSFTTTVLCCHPAAHGIVKTA